MTVKVDIKKYRHKKKGDALFLDVQFSVNENGFYLITGESGVGKSTLMKIMLGLFEGQLEGEIFFESKYGNCTSYELMKAGKIGYQSDDFSLIPWKTVEENMFLPPTLNKNLSVFEIDSFIKEFKKIGLDPDVLHKYAHQLSFGTKARVGIVRACLWNPNIIFLDELFSGVDSKNNQAIIDYLKAKSQNTMIFAISHQITEACKVATTALVINSRRKIIKLSSPTPELILLNLN
jgi:ABC-type proline/glycine betaine transport system ATPase subunit